MEYNVRHKTYLEDRHQNHQIVIRQIDRMLLTNHIGNGLDDHIAAELVIASYRWPDGVLSGGGVQISTILR